MKRFTIDAFNDGHVAFTTLTSIEGGGSAHDRKKRARLKASGDAQERKWTRADRQIFKHGITEPLKFSSDHIELLPLGSEDIAQCSKENDDWSRIYTRFADATVAEIEAQAVAFARDPERGKIRKVKKVVLVNEDGTVEEL